MLDIDFTFVHKRASPLIQLALALGIGWLGMLVCKLISAPSGREYFAALIAIIFYTLMNTVVSIAYKSFLRYTMPSYYIYILLVIVLFFSSKLLSGVSIWSPAAEEYRMMIISISLFFFVAGVMVRGVRFIYELAEREE